MAKRSDVNSNNGRNTGRTGVGGYQEKDASFLTRKDWTMNGSQGKNGDSVDILDNVERNSGNGAPAPINYGTNRKAGM